MLGNSYILIVRMHELFKKCNNSCLDSPPFSVIMEAHQNIYGKASFGVIFVFIGLALSKNFEIGMN